MFSNLSTPIVKDVVLVGGGHSHIEVIRKFGMQPIQGVRLTVISRDIQTPYSGMLPGYISGIYSFEQCHINLAKLSAYGKANLIHGEAQKIDLNNQKVLVDNRPPIPYNILSVNCGITPDFKSVPGVKEHAISVKPINKFVQKLDNILEEYKRSIQGEKQTTRDLQVLVVGGGAGGTEVALSVDNRLKCMLRQGSLKNNQGQVTVNLVTRRQIFQQHDAKVRSQFLNIFQKKGVGLIENNPVVKIEKNRAILQNGSELQFDYCLWCTGALCPEFLQASNFYLDSGGFIKVGETLQAYKNEAEIFENVFAAGDVASIVNHPRPKAGVYAVRSGPFLAQNIKNVLQGQELERYIPQETNLSLITSGERHAVASKGKTTFQSNFLWYVKDYIDNSFMSKYDSKLDFMMDTQSMQTKGQTLKLDQNETLTVQNNAMRCGGCGSKVGSSILNRVLQQLQSNPLNRQHVFPQTNSESQYQFDDCAILSLSSKFSHLNLQTVDYLTEFIHDPFLFGQITTHHCLSDIYAMGGTPTECMCTAVIPYMTEPKMEQCLLEMMEGVTKVLRQEQCKLIGGHTSEGPQMGLGLTVVGEVDKNKLLQKKGMQGGDSIILTKPLGVGVVLAAQMRGQCSANSYIKCLQSMNVSNREASQIFGKLQCHALTDVTGFGLMGHLAEMARASEICVELNLSDIPTIEGALDCIDLGIRSTLFEQNKKIVNVLSDESSLQLFNETSVGQLAADPQTGGGLVGSLPSNQALQCIEQLQQSGYMDAQIIGKVLEKQNNSNSSIRLTYV